MNVNHDFAIDLITQNPNNKKKQKAAVPYSIGLEWIIIVGMTQLLKFILEKGDPNNANSALTPKMRKIKNNPIAQALYRIRDPSEHYPYRLLSWATHLGIFLFY